jgi:hypothetical protein
LGPSYWGSGLLEQERLREGIHLDLPSLTADSTILIWKDKEPIALYGLEKTGHLCLVERTGGRAVGEGDVMFEKKADLRRPLPCAIVDYRGGGQV